MTISQKESEMVLLKTIAGGDGEYVSVELNAARDFLIVDDLQVSGFIDGTTYKNGGKYRITIIGEERLAEVRNALVQEELAGIKTVGEKISKTNQETRALKDQSKKPVSDPTVSKQILIGVVITVVGAAALKLLGLV